MRLIDDATNRREAHFAEEETIFAAMKVLWQWIDCYGIPRALCTDKKNVYVVDEKGMHNRMTCTGRESDRLVVAKEAGNDRGAKGPECRHVAVRGSEDRFDGNIYKGGAGGKAAGVTLTTETTTGPKGETGTSIQVLQFV
jgi:hypothetical protein